MRLPATVIASTMITLMIAPLQSQAGWRAASTNGLRLCLATSRSAKASKAVSAAAQASAPKTPTRSPSLAITATCTEPATPAMTARRMVSTPTPRATLPRFALRSAA